MSTSAGGDTPGHRPSSERPPENARTDDVDRRTRDTDRIHDTESARRGPTAEERRDIVRGRQEAEFGGMKIGAAFFGWLTAVGTTVLLAALVAGVGGAIGFGSGTSADDAVAEATDNAQAVGIGGAIALAVILFIAYFAGGYVAGRMARFNGAKQGVAVWLWAVLVAVLLAVVGAVAGERFDVLSRLDSLPPIPVSSGDLTTSGIVALVVVVTITLGGAVLGGITGMRYHRRVDEVGLAR